MSPRLQYLHLLFLNYGLLPSLASPPLFAPSFSIFPSELLLPSGPLGRRRRSCWNSSAGVLLQDSGPVFLLDLLTSLFLGN